MRILNRYLIYAGNLRAVGADAPKVALMIKGAHLFCPRIPNALNYDLHALASIWQSCASEVDLSALVTAGGAEALAVKAVRLVKSGTQEPLAALKEVLTTSRSPIPLEAPKAQMRLSADEATESSFILPEIEAAMKTIF